MILSPSCMDSHLVHNIKKTGVIVDIFVVVCFSRPPHGVKQRKTELKPEKEQI